MAFGERLRGTDHVLNCAAKAIWREHLGFKEAMMFCRLTRRRAGILLGVLLACPTITFAGDRSQGDPVPADAFSAVSHDRAMDARPVDFDPALLPAVTPTSTFSNDPADKQATVIPLPPAAWTGMAGLFSLGLIRARHKLRKFLS